MTETTTAQVEERVDRIKAGAIEIHQQVGGMMIETVEQLFKIADALSRSGVAVPPHCRGVPGTVFALLVQAQEWGLPFMSVINKSYVTKGKGGVERLAYEAQLIHTLIETRANLTGKLREEFIGEGDDMICRVSGTFRGETKPHSWDSEPVGKIRKDIGYNEQGNFKGSPLWLTKPKVQLHYSTCRDWARVHCPWVILGVYTPEEIADAEPIDITPKVADLAKRLKDARAHHTPEHRGFNADHVEREASAQKDNTIHDDANGGAVATEEASDGETEGGTTRRHDTEAGPDGSGAADRLGGDAAEPGGGRSVDHEAGGAEGRDAGGAEASEAGQGDLLGEKPRRSKKR